MNDPDSRSETPQSGLFVTVDELNYAYEPLQAPADRPHLFTYHLTIHNRSEGTVTILGRKWILSYENGETDIIEGDKVIGKTPELAPGQCFAYASFHLIPTNASARGAFFGMDDSGAPVSVMIPEFKLILPGDSACN